MSRAGFPGALPAAGFVSVYKVIGTRLYGLVATSTNAGHDEPFVYDLGTNTFVALTGVTAANTPVNSRRTLIPSAASMTRFDAPARISMPVRVWLTSP